jgi:cardiolipin synthase
MPIGFSRRAAYFNLRNHRKILVVDGRVGFTGGMNIQRGHRLSDNPHRARRDLHFRVRGPVTAQLQEVFAEDWEFTTGEALLGKRWFPYLSPAGATAARGIAEGPDEDFEKVYWTFMGAAQCARNSLRIVTPYFLPDRPLMASLKAAALRGVRVDIVLPRVSDNRMIQWAMWRGFWELLESRCNIWLTGPPFDHAKLLIVDGEWAMFGSPNWDPRSFRLNFEFAIECYDTALAASLSTLVEERIRGAEELTQARVDGRSLPVKLRDGAAGLFTPYL